VHPAEGVELVASVVRAWIRRDHRRARVDESRTMIGFLARRTEEVAGRVARGAAPPVLAFPSHGGGWLDPEVLAARERATGRIFNRADPVDRLQAGVRASPSLASIAYTRDRCEPNRNGDTPHANSAWCAGLCPRSSASSGRRSHMRATSKRAD
jgi:hypothetical protein